MIVSIDCVVILLNLQTVFYIQGENTQPEHTQHPEDTQQPASKRPKLQSNKQSDSVRILQSKVSFFTLEACVGLVIYMSLLLFRISKRRDS